MKNNVEEVRLINLKYLNMKIIITFTKVTIGKALYYNVEEKTISL